VMNEASKSPPPPPPAGDSETPEGTTRSVGPSPPMQAPATRSPASPGP
jgi:hypothetical protein